MTSRRGWAARSITAVARVALPALCAVAPVGAQYGSAVVDIDSVLSVDAVYVGDQVCKLCHITAYETWLGTAHSRSWVFLSTSMADSIALRMEGGPVATPRSSARCLSCHGTAAKVEASDRMQGFELAEGVQCEGCHGPGGMHTTPGLFLFGEKLAASQMEIPDQAACQICHKLPSSHIILERPDFDYNKAAKRIAHPIPAAEARSLRWERPGAWVSLSLRTLLGRWFP